jgi:REP element-mobilizing transposase RayT
MPDHVHLLVELAPESRVAEWAHVAKLRARLVSSLENYPYWGSQLYSREVLLQTDWSATPQQWSGRSSDRPTTVQSRD